MSIMVVLSQMVRLFIMMCLGYLLYKLDIIDNHTRQHMTKFVLYVTTPTLIVYPFIKNLGDGDNGTLGLLFAVAIGLYVLLPLIGAILNVILHVRKPEQGLYMFMSVFSNVGFMGFPVVESLYGAKGLFYAAVFNCLFNICVYTIGVYMVTYGNENSSSFKEMLSIKKLLNPGVICCFIAVILFLARVELPETGLELLGTIGGLTSPLAMILVGASLAMMNPREIISGDIRVYIYSTVRQFLLPLILWPLINMLIKDRVLAVVTLIMVAMPVANSAVLFATEYKSDEKLASRTVFITTVMALVSIPFILWLCV